MLFSGEVVGVMHITSGIKQGGHMSGSFFALSVDPFLSCVLTRSLVGLIRLTAYADDLAFSRIWRRGFGWGIRWALASASVEPRQVRLRALVAVLGQRRSRCALRGVPRAGRLHD